MHFGVFANPLYVEIFEKKSAVSLYLVVCLKYEELGGRSVVCAEGPRH